MGGDDALSRQFADLTVGSGLGLRVQMGFGFLHADHDERVDGGFLLHPELDQRSKHKEGREATAAAPLETKGEACAVGCGDLDVQQASKVAKVGWKAQEIYLRGPRTQGPCQSGHVRLDTGQSRAGCSDVIP